MINAFKIAQLHIRSCNPGSPIDPLVVPEQHQQIFCPTAQYRKEIDGDSNKDEGEDCNEEEDGHEEEDDSNIGGTDPKSWTNKS